MLREGELLQERPTDVAVALFVAAALLGAEHDLRAVLAVGVFVTAVGVLFGTENLRARTAESVGIRAPIS